MTVMIAGSSYYDLYTIAAMTYMPGFQIMCVSLQQTTMHICLLALVRPFWSTATYISQESHACILAVEHALTFSYHSYHVVQVQ